jgi:hypothetical protein
MTNLIIYKNIIILHLVLTFSNSVHVVQFNSLILLIRQFIYYLK